MSDAATRNGRRLAVVKLGSSTLTDGEGRVDRAYLADLAYQVNRARKAGWDVIIVSSGSIPCGLEALGMPLERPKHMPTVQAAASVGMRALLAAYDQVFSPYGILTSLVLLTRRDTADRTAYLHARDTFHRLVELGCVPIVNENDTVSVEQIKFGDNDTLAALVACLADADRVTIVTYGGSGHEPAQAGFVGTGMLDVQAVGDIFAAPNGKLVFDAMKLADKGHGVLLLTLNYAGDQLAGKQAMKLAEKAGLNFRQVVTGEEVQFDPNGEDNKRGLAGAVAGLPLLHFLFQNPSLY